MMKRWFVVHTRPNGEQRALVNLERQDFAAWLPVYAKHRRHARRVETVQRPMFPRYLFVSVDLEAERWRAILSTYGVAGLVGAGDGPEPVPDGIVEALASGRFYASTGVEIESVGVAGGGEQAIVESDADEIHWIGSHGVILKKERGGSGSIAALEVVGGLGGNAASESRPVAYVRAECLGRGSAVAWTQPFWVTE